MRVVTAPTSWPPVLTKVLWWSLLAAATGSGQQTDPSLMQGNGGIPISHYVDHLMPKLGSVVQVWSIMKLLWVVHVARDPKPRLIRAANLMETGMRVFTLQTHNESKSSVDIADRRKIVGQMIAIAAPRTANRQGLCEA